MKPSIQLGSTLKDFSRIFRFVSNDDFFKGLSNPNKLVMTFVIVSIGMMLKSELEKALLDGVDILCWRETKNFVGIRRQISTVLVKDSREEESFAEDSVHLAVIVPAATQKMRRGRRAALETAHR